jgi:hypothetical protein
MYNYDNDFAAEFMESSCTDVIATQPDPTQCCVNCVTIINTNCHIDVSDLCSANPDCVVCALLLRAAKPYMNNQEEVHHITRDKTALTIGGNRSRFLRVGTTLGECIHPSCTSKTTYLLHTFSGRVVGCA